MKWRRNRSNPARWNRNHLIQKHGAVCALCNKKFNSKKDITIDHIIPMSKGGIDELSNMQLAHDYCNLMKADMTPEEFAEYQA